MQQHAATAKRIYENIQVLLSTGQFPGTAASAIAEAQQFLAPIVKQLEESDVKAGTETGSGVQPEADAGRVGGEPVGNRRRQGRKPKAK